ncbi:MAG: hypothetical protein NT027_08885 [Proteobacteria bacterium]|nr:hypothetical protein [Pseudomonadota bacterium]
MSLSSALKSLVATIVLMSSMMSLSSCKKKSKSDSKSLENLAGGNFRTNLCWANPSSSDGNAPLLATSIALDPALDQATADQMTTEAVLALTAVPKSVQNIFSSMKGIIYLSSKAGEDCTDLLKNRVGKNLPEACYRIGPNRGSNSGQTLEIILQASSESIRHNLVREFGYFMAQVFSTTDVIGTDGVTQVVAKLPFEKPGFLQDKEFLASRFISDVKGEGIFDPKVVFSYALNAKNDAEVAQTIRDVVFADAFDSYYCNSWSLKNLDIIEKVKKHELPFTELKNVENTRVMMVKLFPKSHLAFSGLHCKYFAEPFDPLCSQLIAKEAASRLSEKTSLGLSGTGGSSTSSSVAATIKSAPSSGISSPSHSSMKAVLSPVTTAAIHAGGSYPAGSSTASGTKTSSSSSVSKSPSNGFTNSFGAGASNSTASKSGSTASTSGPQGSSSSSSNAGRIPLQAIGFKPIPFVTKSLPSGTNAEAAKKAAGSAVLSTPPAKGLETADHLKTFYSNQTRLAEIEKEMQKKGPLNPDFMRLQGERQNLNKRMGDSYTSLPENLQKNIVQDNVSEKAFYKKLNDKANLDAALEKDAQLGKYKDEAAKKFVKQHLSGSKDVDSMNTADLYKAVGQAQKEKDVRTDVRNAYYGTLGSHLKGTMQSGADGVSKFGNEVLPEIDRLGVLPPGVYEASYTGTFYASKLLSGAGSVAEAGSDLVRDPEAFSKKSAENIKGAVNATIEDRNGRAALYRDGGAGTTQSYIAAWTPGIGKMEKAITDVDNNGENLNRDGVARVSDGMMGVSDFFGAAASGATAVKGVSSLSGKFLTQSGGFVDKAGDASRLSHAGMKSVPAGGVVDDAAKAGKIADKAEDAASADKSGKKVSPCLALGDTIDPCDLKVNPVAERSKSQVLSEQLSRAVDHDVRLRERVVEELKSTNPDGTVTKSGNLLDDILDQDQIANKRPDSADYLKEGATQNREHLARSASEYQREMTDKWSELQKSTPAKPNISDSALSSPRKYQVDSLIAHVEGTKKHYEKLKGVADEAVEAEMLNQNIGKYVKENPMDKLGGAGPSTGYTAEGLVDDAVNQAMKSHYPGELDKAKKAMNESLAQSREQLVKMKQGNDNYLQKMEMKERDGFLTKADTEQLAEARALKEKFKGMDLSIPKPSAPSANLNTLIEATSQRGRYQWQLD